MTTTSIDRRHLLGCIASTPAAIALPAAVALAEALAKVPGEDDTELLAACDRFWAIYNAEVADEDFADLDPGPCRSAGHAVAAMPAHTTRGVFAKTLIALEAVHSGRAVWDEALAAGITADIERLEGGTLA